MVEPSWRRRAQRRRGPEPSPSGAVPSGPATGGTVYVAGNLDIRAGDFLGDSITQILAQSIIWEAERPARTILTMYRGNPLNFLWERYIARSGAEVIEEDPVNGDVMRRTCMYDQRRAERAVNGIPFDRYKECYRCMDWRNRCHAMGASVPEDVPIVPRYYLGQEQAITPMPYWATAPHHFGFSWRGGGPVLISPLEKCQNNAVFTFPMWRMVIKHLLARDIPVVVNERSKFCSDLPIKQTFLPFPGLLGQIAEASVVACGNTGPMWAAAIVGAPSVICETPNVAMPEYTAHSARLCGMRYLMIRPDPEAIAARIEEVYRDVSGA